MSPALQADALASEPPGNARMGESQPGIKIARRNINNLRYAHNTTLRAYSQEELKSLLMRVKESVKKLARNSTFKKRR